MSLTFIGIVKLHEGAGVGQGLEPTQRGEFARALTALTLQYGYGVKFHKRHLYWELPWVDTVIDLLGGPKNTMLFEVTSSPEDEMAHQIYVRELRVPLDWEKVRFPDLLLKIWRQPVVRSVVFARVVGAGTLWDISVDELPPPTSVYRVMDEMVALRANMDVPTKLFYLDKQSLEPWHGS